MKALWLMISVSFKADRRYAILLCLAQPLSWLAPTTGAIATKVLVDAAIHRDTDTAILAGAIAAISVLLTLGATQVAIFVIHALGKKADAYIQRRLGELMTRPPTIEHYERPEYLDRVQMLRRQVGVIGAGLNATVQLAAATCQVAVVCILLATREPWLLLLVLFGIPSFIASAIARRLTTNAYDRTAEPDRLQHKLIRLASDVPTAREARLYGLAEDLRTRRRRLADTVKRARNHAAIAGEMLRVAGQMAFGIGYIGAMVLVLRAAARGELSAGDVAMVLVLAGQVEGFISNLVSGTQFILSVHQIAERMRWLETYDAHARRSGGVAPNRLSQQIRLDRVSFRYPGTESLVLDHISMKLPAGATIALVGDNGAGKTTLVKLLIGLYRPTSGQILLDDVDLATIDPTLWQTHTSAIFQDYTKPEFHVRQAIGLGDTQHLEDTTTMEAAINRAGTRGLIQTLPAHLDTQLGATWNDGIDLSGGQWQQIALTRGRIRAHPILLVLDEPTAAIDAESEDQLFRRFTAAAHDARSSGAITLLVTHRFSTVRTADQILVLNDGRIQEHGSHDELIRADGLYAELYNLQATAYR